MCFYCDYVRQFGNEGPESTQEGETTKLTIFKPGACGFQPLAPGFLKLLWSAYQYARVCVFVCPPPRTLITSGVIWCDIGHVLLVKQVLRLSPAFNYFI